MVLNVVKDEKAILKDFEFLSATQWNRWILAPEDAVNPSLETVPGDLDVASLPHTLPPPTPIDSTRLHLRTEFTLGGNFDRIRTIGKAGRRLDYHELKVLRQNHPGWRLLVADNGPLVISFLYRAFLLPNVRELSQSALGVLLDDFLYQLHETLGEVRYPRAAVEYLGNWADDERGWLRKFYPAGGDEPHYDLTPATEKAIQWLVELQQRRFVGTESRLRVIFELLQQMVAGMETDPQARLEKLLRQRADIDAQIARVQDGDLDFMDATQLRERFYQVEQTAHDLLADFRQVEQNFRDLDRTVREQITLWEGGKGELLETVFGERDNIADSDQGRSFHAFWDFLMSPSRQEEFTTLLDQVLGMDSIAQLHPDQRLARVHYDWLDAGENTQHTVAALSGQLRKYLDDQVWLENRRIMNLINGIERHAVEIREQIPQGVFAELDETSPRVQLTMDRPLYSPPFKPNICQQVLEESGDSLAADALYEQVYVDKAQLSTQIRQALQTREQVELTTLLELHPLRQGLAELVAYLSLAAEDGNAVIHDSDTDWVEWIDTTGMTRKAAMPVVIFSR